LEKKENNKIKGEIFRDERARGRTVRHYVLLRIEKLVAVAVAGGRKKSTIGSTQFPSREQSSMLKELRISINDLRITK